MVINYTKTNIFSFLQIPSHSIQSNKDIESIPRNVIPKEKIQKNYSILDTNLQESNNCEQQSQYVRSQFNKVEMQLVSGTTTLIPKYQDTKERIVPNLYSFNVSPIGAQYHQINKIRDRSNDINNHSDQAIQNSMNRFIHFLTKKGKKKKAETLFIQSLKKIVKLIEKETELLTLSNKHSFDRFSAESKNNQHLMEVSILRNQSRIHRGDEITHPEIKAKYLDSLSQLRYSITPSTKGTQYHEESKGISLNKIDTLTSVEPQIENSVKVRSLMRSKEQEEIDFLKLNVHIFFQEAIQNIKPSFEVKKVRIAGTTYQVPSLLSLQRQENIAMNWLLQSTRERKKKNASFSFETCLAFEIYDAFKKQGQARNKRNELHKLAELNRAYSHFRWW